MALSAPVALVRAHYRSSWNRIIRDAGFGGKVATIGMLTIVAAVVFLPGMFAIRLGRDLGAELAVTGDAGVLRSWNALQTTFTVAFALLGSFRLKPVFSFTRFGRYPLSPMQLLLAELPASLFEVFPLLGGGATILMSVGLATRMPRSAHLVALLAIDGIVTLLAVMFIASALLAWTARHRTLVALAAIATAAAIFWSGLAGLRVIVKEWLPAFAQSIPGSRGYAGLVALRSGDIGPGLAGIGTSVSASVILFLLAAQIHRRRLTSEADRAERRPGSERALRFGSAQAAVGRLFLRQLLGSMAVRAQLLLPLLYTAPIALVIAMSRSALAEDKAVPENLLGVLIRVETAPLYAIVPLLAVVMNAQIWMNQFGWDRGGLRTMLLLPLESRDLFVGKLRGLAGFTAIQAAIGVVPLLTVRAPTLRELVIGVAVGGVALVVTTAVGHVVSIRFPRGIDGTAGIQIPLHLSWIAPVTLLATGAELAGVYAIAELLVKGAGVLMLVLSLAGAIAAYVALLPRLAALLREQRERLLTM